MWSDILGWEGMSEKLYKNFVKQESNNWLFHTEAEDGRSNSYLNQMRLYGIVMSALSFRK